MASNPATTQFRIPVNDYLGHNYNAFRDRLFAMAISNPSDYFKMREAIVKDVKTKAVKDLYNVLYDTLTEGTTGGGRSVDKGGVSFEFKPALPPQSANELCLGAAKTLDKILDDVLDIIIPIDYHSIASKRLEMKGSSAGIS